MFKYVYVQISWSLGDDLMLKDDEHHAEIFWKNACDINVYGLILWSRISYFMLMFDDYYAMICYD